VAYTVRTSLFIQFEHGTLFVPNKQLEGTDVDLHQYLRKEYLIGDRIVVNVVRDGKELRLPWTLR